jgi:hypothetical protein
MVHGTTYTVRYIIKLKNPIDYYDVLLPICSANRKMFELINQNNQTLLVVFGEKDLDKRFDSKPNIREYYKVMSSTEYTGPKDKEEIEYENANIKYWQAHMYSSRVKILVDNNFIPDKVYSDEEINELKIKGNEIIKKLNTLSNRSEEYWNLESELDKIKFIIKLNPIFNSSTKDEIIELEKELSTIELTDEEKMILEKVKLDPNISSNIEAEGFQLYSYIW